MSEKQLTHYGVAGMKWGVRKASKKGKLKRAAKKVKTAIKKKKPTFPDPKKMSYEDLKREVDRMEKEKKYLELTGQKRSKADGWVRTALKNAAGTALQNAAGAIFSTLLNVGVKSVKDHYSDKQARKDAAKAAVDAFKTKKASQKTYLDSPKGTAGTRPTAKTEKAKKYTPKKTYTTSDAEAFVSRFISLGPGDFSVHSDS